MNFLKHLPLRCIQNHLFTHKLKAIYSVSYLLLRRIFLKLHLSDYFVACAFFILRFYIFFMLKSVRQSNWFTRGVFFAAQKQSLFGPKVLLFNHRLLHYKAIIIPSWLWIWDQSVVHLSQGLSNTWHDLIDFLRFQDLETFDFSHALLVNLQLLKDFAIFWTLSQHLTRLRRFYSFFWFTNTLDTLILLLCTYLARIHSIYPFYFTDRVDHFQLWHHQGQFFHL